MPWCQDPPTRVEFAKTAAVDGPFVEIAHQDRGAIVIALGHVGEDAADLVTPAQP